MEAYLGQLVLLAFNRCPNIMMFCEGQLLPISQYDALFTLLGTTYGGDGVNTFALPDLRGRTPVGQGTTPNGPYPMGMMAGSESVTLTVAQLPAHSHSMTVTTAASNNSVPKATIFSATTGPLIYGDGQTLTPLAPNTIGAVGGNQPHENRQPYLAMRWAIVMEGLFPSRS